MKKFFGLSLAMIAMSVGASATTVSTTCTPSPAPMLGQSNATVVNCAGFVVPVGATINWIKADLIVDININGFGTGSTVTAYSSDAPGSGLDFSGIVDAATRPVNDSKTITSGFAPFLAAFAVNQSYGGVSSTVTGATFNERFTLDYTQVPEPGTYALMGAGLIGLYFARRRS